MTPPVGPRTQFSEIPCNRLFGLELISSSDGHAEVTMPVSGSYAQEVNVVHGGIITTLADTTAVYALYPHLPAGKTMTSIELKVNFLRPAVPTGDPLQARARVIKRGENIGVCQVDVSQGEKEVATGIFTYLIFEKEAEERNT
jgi:uncharacterized protein (TIGR00369 family)